MKDQNPKGQHYVQRAYLEGFQDPSLEKSGKSFVWVYIPGKSPFRQRPEQAARINYYYCYQDAEKKNFDAEHGLQKLEDWALPVLRKLRDRDFSLNEEDRLTFAGYVALCHTRVPTFERSTNRITELVSAKQLELTARDDKTLRSAVEAMSAESGEHIDVDEFRKNLTGGTVEVVQANRGWSLRQMFRMLQVIQEAIFKMEWAFLLAPDGDDGFLTSDNPVCLFDPMNPFGGIGFASSAAAYFTFPVSRSICLLAQHRPSVKTSEIRTAQVRTVNKGTITRADTQLYAPFQSPRVQAVLDDVTKRRPPRTTVLFKEGEAVEE